MGLRVERAFALQHSPKHTHDPASPQIAFLSTPSLYFSTSEARRATSKLFEVCKGRGGGSLGCCAWRSACVWCSASPQSPSQFDMAWSKDPGFVNYNYKEPECIPTELHHQVLPPTSHLLVLLN
jgi:hypothetical protein